MYREIVKQYRGEKTVAFITLTSGAYAVGVIENHGTEALLLRQKDGTAKLVMKQAIETMCPRSAVNPIPRKKREEG